MSSHQSRAVITPEATIAEITNSNKQAAELLASIGLSLSRHEDETLRSVCQKQQWSEAELMEWIKNHSTVVGRRESSLPAGDDSLTAWEQYLLESHILPAKRLLKEIKGSGFLQDQALCTLIDALQMYYTFEEKQLFPLCKRLDDGRKANVRHGIIRKLKHAFSVLERDRDRLRHLIKTIRNNRQSIQGSDDTSAIQQMQHENIKHIFKNLSKQFEVEEQRFIPRIKKEIKAKQ